MSKFKFLGVDEQDEITLRETTFEKGKAVDVHCDALASKLRGLDYFEEVKSAAKPKAPAKPKASAEPDPAPVAAAD